MRKIKVTLYFFLLIIFSCVNNISNQNKFTLSKTEVLRETYNFGEIGIGDTVSYKFLIKNLSSNYYKIEKIAVSCGCVAVYYSKDSIPKNNFAEIVVRYNPSVEDKNFIRKSIVISDNSESGFNSFYLEGTIK